MSIITLIGADFLDKDTRTLKIRVEVYPETALDPRSLNPAWPPLHNCAGHFWHMIHYNPSQNEPEIFDQTIDSALYRHYTSSVLCSRPFGINAVRTADARGQR